MKNYSKIYLKNRPLFISIIRSKEASLFVEDLPYKKPVLDFGCGDGFYTKNVICPDQGKVDCGVDINQKAINIAKESKAYKKLCVYDGKKLPFRNNSFSTVFSNCVLEHVEHLEENLDEIHRILKPKGIFVCSVMTNKWDDYLAGNIISRKYYRKWMRKIQVHLQLPTYNKWCLLFVKSGFTIKESIGYMDKRASWWMDVLHYVSLPSLITHKMFRKWVVFPWMFDLVPVDKLIKRLSQNNISKNKSAAIYFQLVKD